MPKVKDKEDNPLIPNIVGQALIVKDGGMLLQLPNLGQVLSEARDSAIRSSMIRESATP